MSVDGFPGHLREPPRGWQVDAIARLLKRVSGTAGRNVESWADAIWLAGCAKQADISEAASDLERLSAALRVGPTARIALLHAPEGRVDVGEIAKIVDAMASRARSGRRRGHPGADVTHVLGNLISAAFHDLTGMPLPTTNPYRDRKIDHPYTSFVGSSSSWPDLAPVGKTPLMRLLAVGESITAEIG